MIKSDAVVATARVSVNVMPVSSFSVSNRFALSIPLKKDLKNQWIHNEQIAIKSLSNKTSVKVKANGDQNTHYHLTISSKSILTDSSSSNTITIKDMKMRINTSSNSSDDEQEVRIEGMLTKPNSQKPGSYSGTTEITLNYN